MDTSRQLDNQTSRQPNFRESLVNKADNLAHFIYPLTYKFPTEEKFALGDQIRRSIVSVPTNIIEGIARGGDKEKRRFSSIAYGSLKEAKYLFTFAYKEGLINSSDYEEASPMFDELSRLLFSFIKVLKGDI